MEEQILLKNKFSYLLPICDRPSTLTSYSICDQLHILTSLLLSTTPLLQQDRVDTACQRDGLPAAVASHHLSPPALSHVKRDLLQCQKRPITAIPTSHHGHGLCNSTQHLLKFNRSSPRGLFCCPPVREGFETRGLRLTLRSSVARLVNLFVLRPAHRKSNGNNQVHFLCVCRYTNSASKMRSERGKYSGLNA